MGVDAGLRNAKLHRDEVGNDAEEMHDVGK
jgi:hypothetical protein